MQSGLALLQSASSHAGNLGHQRRCSGQVNWLHTHGLRPQVINLIYRTANQAHLKVVSHDIVSPGLQVQW